jgi:hypothetical protein
VIADSSSRTRNTGDRLAPGTWWRVVDLAIAPGGTVYYQLDSTFGRPADARDARGRSPLEAFSSLPFETMTAALDAYGQTLSGRSERRWEQQPAIAAIDAFRSFVETFGPVGVRWGDTFYVSNPEAERLQREGDRQRAVALGVNPETVVTRRFGDTFWTASFWGHGPGRQAIPAVRRGSTYPNLEWAERIDLGDEKLASDLWRQIVDEQHDLLRALDLAEGLARNDGLACRKVLLEVLNSPDFELDTHPNDPRGEDLRRIVRRRRRADGRIRPFRAPIPDVDWLAFGRIVLSWLITRQIDFAMPMVGLSAANRFRVEWQAASLVEVMYLELFEHVRERPGFGVAECERCGGRILRTRLRGGTGNRWHRGCQGGRVARWRREHPDWRSRRRTA